MTKKIRVAIAGVGNCASALIQGIDYYKSVHEQDSIGLTAYELDGYTPVDIEFVAAFDVSDSKVGLDLSEAIFSTPNNAKKITNVNNLDVKVNKGKVLDGVGRHLAEKINVSNSPTVGEFDTFIFSARCLPTPSKTFPLFTLTSKLLTLVIFLALLGVEKIASERSKPTFESETSKAATNSISTG